MNPAGLPRKPAASPELQAAAWRELWRILLGRAAEAIAREASEQPDQVGKDAAA